MKFENIISLGFFCSVANNLEELGLRNTSGPFDWLISPWSGIEKLIENNFFEFLDEEYLYQIKGEKYKNIKYDVEFYHEFDRYKDFSTQLPFVKEKYEKRILKFYDSIKQPTLFIRYIKNYDELVYHENNYEHVLKLLKKYNPNNEIVFILNDEINKTQLPHYSVKPDKDDIVNRNPLFANSELQELLFKNFDENQRKMNLEFYNRKKKNPCVLFKKRLINKIKRWFLRAYAHDKRL